MTVAPVRPQTSILIKVLRVLQRIAYIILLGLVIGWVLNRAETTLEHRNQRAGFIHGVVQGALMPMALPNLAFGNDVPIYSANNTGRTYKLGYTAGVNVCGLIFFGFFFWRVRKLKRRLE
ncbi:MAG TPA: hypothetical protein VK530_00105 [Candidatus Acidoferrum sp.]|nr:hypothetical protein [Candidatus Acidoferrum sp.]